MFPPYYFGPVGNVALPVTLRFFSNPPTNSTPIVGANVWVSNAQTESPGQLVVGPIVTDNNGKAAFSLVPGDTYYVWMELAGFDPIEGQSFVAVAD